LQVRARIVALVPAFDHRWPVADDFHEIENAKWMIRDRGAMLGRDPRKLRVGEVGVRTREIELEVDDARHA
jgi:hypothetical protein